MHLNADFANKAWWLVKLYIDETTIAPTEFSNWLALNPSLAKRDVIDIIDNDYDQLKTEAQTIYKTAVADHLAAYKIWRDAISDANQLADYRVLQEAIDKHAEYVRNFSPRHYIYVNYNKKILAFEKWAVFFCYGLS